MRGPTANIQPFLFACEKHHTRYLQKIARLRATQTTPKPAIDDAQRKIEETYSLEINRIVALGVVEFEH